MGKEELLTTTKNIEKKKKRDVCPKKLMLTRVLHSENIKE